MLSKVETLSAHFETDIIRLACLHAQVDILLDAIADREKQRLDDFISSANNTRNTDIDTLKKSSVYQSIEIIRHAASVYRGEAEPWLRET